MKGFINLIKPQGMSSAAAVSVVKKKLKITCGHMGTLDPMASGVLPVAIDKTCRLFPYLLEKEKEYEATFKFGVETDTLDVTGEVTALSDKIPDISEIREKLSSFTGEIEQIPPKYSSKCVNGKRGYELARKGVDFELKPKKVLINDIACTGLTGEGEYAFKVKCGGGTYIRSLARDIGRACGSLAVMSSLTRTKSGKFIIEDGVSVEDFKESIDPEQYIIPADFAVDFPKLILKSEQARKILNGVFLNYGFKDGTYRVYNGEEFWGVGKSEGGVLKIDAYVR